MRDTTDIPVLLLNFNRPGHTSRALEALAALAPQNFYAAVDGPRAQNESDVRKCREVQELLRAVPWARSKKFLFREKNLGCRAAVSEAISWFFQEVEFGIILEDDCLVDRSFFDLCAYAKDNFAEDSRIMGISASNFQHGKWRGDGSFYFSRIQAVWGWATWRRAWEKYSADPQTYHRYMQTGKLKEALPDPLTRFVWNHKIEDSMQGGSSWAFPWIFSTLKNDGLVIVPNKNLATNIGHGAEATHHLQRRSAFLRSPAVPLGEIRAPSKIAVNVAADRYFSRLMLSEQVFGDTWAQRTKNVALFMLKKSVGTSAYHRLRGWARSCLNSRTRPR